MLKIEEEQEYVRMLEGGKAMLRDIALSSPLAIPRILHLGVNIKQGLLECAGRFEISGGMERFV